jgi:hypothetical protein
MHISSSTHMDIIRWWEARRLRYNLYVGAGGVVTWLVVEIAGSAAVRPGVDFEEPIVMLIGPLLYGIAANVCYTFGSMVDVAAYRGSPRQWLYTLGLRFSLVLTALPGVWALLVWLYTIYTGHKLGRG